MIEPKVKALSQSCYEVSYTPASRGRHNLSLKINGEHIAGSPFGVFIQIPHSELKEPVATNTDVKGPTGLHISGDRIVISDYGGDQILVYSRELKRVGKIGGKTLVFKNTPKLKGCGESTSDRESNIYIATVEDNLLHKFSKDGTHIKMASGTGEPGGQFGHPNGLRILHNTLFVCDTFNDRVVVFDTDLNYLSTLTTCPQPSSIDIDAAGRMYISMHIHNGYIRVLDTDWKLLYDISHSSLNRPVTVKIFNDLLYVTDIKMNCVVIFTLLGEFVGSFGHAHLVKPEGIAIDNDGYVFVTNNRNVVVF